jgi:hypothetical protein
MRLIRLLPGAFLAVIVACGSETMTTEPGALTITLNGPPPTLTSTGTLQITGQVTRTPAADVPIVVTATGGPNAVSDTATAGGGFAMSVGLTLNALNNLTISASDEAGSTVTPVSLAVRHDALPPQVASMSPTAGADGVTPATIQVVFGEPVRPGSPAFALSLYGVDVPGSAALSTDSLTLTFTPSAALVANAVHLVTVTGARDVVGNTLITGGGCFVTGGTGLTVLPDTGPLYQFGTPAGLVAPDLQQLRLGRTATTLHGVMQFTLPRSLDPSAANNTSAWIDLDVDQDGGTGFVPYKDFVFAGLLPPSGAASEFLIEMGTLDNVDGALVAMYTAQDTAAGTFQATVTAPLSPSTCGTLLGFAVPFSAIGGDDGALDLTVYVDVFGNGAGIIDPAPDAGVFSASLTAAAGASAGVPLRPTGGQTLSVRRRPLSIRPR